VPTQHHLRRVAIEIHEPDGAIVRGVREPAVRGPAEGDRRRVALGRQPITGAAVPDLHRTGRERGHRDPSGVVVDGHAPSRDPGVASISVVRPSRRSTNATSSAPWLERRLQRGDRLRDRPSFGRRGGRRALRGRAGCPFWVRLDRQQRLAGELAGAGQPFPAPPRADRWSTATALNGEVAASATARAADVRRRRGAARSRRRRSTAARAR
jgi:hypothetical protein